MSSVEYLLCEELLKVSETQRELSFPKIEDLLGRRVTHDRLPFHLHGIGVIFMKRIALMYEPTLDVNHHRFLKHEVLRTNGLVQECQDAAMMSWVFKGIGLYWPRFKWDNFVCDRGTMVFLLRISSAS